MKKALSIILALTMMLCLFVGCQPADNTTGAPTLDLAGTYDIKVWVAKDHVALVTKQIADFNAANADKNIVINATVQECGENDAATKVTTDIEAAADLYTLAQDQLARLVEAGALAKLGPAAAETVTSINLAHAVNAAKVGSNLYAYPMTADNGYFMYYDKSVVKEESLGSLESILADCAAANKKFSMAVANDAWFAASFFFGAGCVSSWATNDEGKFDTVDDDFHGDKGLIAAKGMQILFNSGVHVDSSSADDLSAAIPSAVLVSGTWNYKNALTVLGDNLGVAELPSFTVDGKAYHMGSFSGYKMVGVKPQSDAKRAAVLQQLALFLTDEARQLERFNELAWGPSNVKASESESVKANPALAALNKQGAYAVPQGQIPAGWWDTTKALAAAIAKATNDDELKAAQTAYREAILKMADPATQLDPDQWTVIGIGGKWSDGDDKLMTKQADGTWKSNEAFELKAGDEFKCRMGGQWATQVGAAGAEDPSNPPNFKVEADGTYYVVVDPEAKTITLVNA